MTSKDGWVKPKSRLPKDGEQVEFIYKFKGEEVHLKDGKFHVGLGDNIFQSNSKPLKWQFSIFVDKWRSKSLT